MILRSPGVSPPKSPGTPLAANSSFRSSYQQGFPCRKL
jgi:hypothetical protein